MSGDDDLLGKASGLFEKLGSTLKQTTKQVTGLGRGAIRVDLDRPAHDRTSVVVGDTLRGRVTLELPEPIEAERLWVTLFAYADVGAFERRERALQTWSSTRPRFERGVIPFQLAIPHTAFDLPSPSRQPLADAVRAIGALLDESREAMTWSVVARLEIPRGRDLTSSVDVVIER